MPRVSVIINVYNGEATLRATIDSVLAQTFTDWELILWDDCSNDGSPGLLASYRDRRIRIFRSSVNQGLGQSRISALENAVGEWVGFVDQDDLWAPSKLEKQVELADRKPELGFVYGRALTFYPDGRLLDYDHRHEYGPLPEGDIFERLFVDSCFIAIGTALFRRSGFSQVPALPGNISTCPDYHMYLAFARAYKVAAVQEVVCFYRIHAGNMSHTHGLRMQHEIIQIINDWSGQLTPPLVRKRRRIHSTLLALHQMRSRVGLWTGLRTLLVEGGVFYLASRPFARAFRSIQRRMRTPYWVSGGGLSEAQLSSLTQ